MTKKQKPKEIKAPNYFLEVNRKVGEIEEKIAKELDISVVWLREQGKKDMREFTEAIKEYTSVREMKGEVQRDKVRRINSLVEIAGRYSAYKWARFRLENIDNEFGSAIKLRYNEKEQTISIGVKESPIIVLAKGAGNQLKKILKL